jgi:UDP-N-acetyl-D-mannosaminuronate dehydrogenase
MIQRAAAIGVPAELITAARAVNRNMPIHVAGVVCKLMSKHGIEAKDARVLLLGWSYKAEVGDPRETPAAPLSEALLSNGVKVGAWDPYIKPEQFPQGIDVVEDISLAQGYDAVIFVTAHKACLEIDFVTLASNMRTPLLYDGRRVLDLDELTESGWICHAVGRPNGL